MGPLRRRIAIDGCVFRVISTPHARTDAPVIVLLHGIGMSHRYFEPLRRMLAIDAHVVSIDLPGFARLPKPPHDLDIARMADLLAKLMPSASERASVVVGHSMGAQWAVELAVRHPARVSMLVGIGPVTDAAHRDLGAQGRALAIDTLRESPLSNVVVFTDYLRTGVRWYLRQVRHMLGYRLEDRVRELTVPLLLIRGGIDPVSGREWCRSIRDWAARSRLIEIPRAPHVAQRSSPRAVASAILAHIDDEWAEAVR